MNNRKVSYSFVVIEQQAFNWFFVNNNFANFSAIDYTSLVNDGYLHQNASLDCTGTAPSATNCTFTDPWAGNITLTATTDNNDAVIEVNTPNNAACAGLVAAFPGGVCTGTDFTLGVVTGVPGATA